MCSFSVILTSLHSLNLSFPLLFCHIFIVNIFTSVSFKYMHNSNPRGSEILVWHMVEDSCVSWVERTLKTWLEIFPREGKVWCKTRVRKTLYPWLPTFLREENSNIKLGASESLALVGNHLKMVPCKEYWW